MVIDPNRPMHGSLLSDRWVSSLPCSDTRANVQVVVKEQVALSMTNTRSHMDVCSLVSDFLDAAVI